MLQIYNRILAQERSKFASPNAAKRNRKKKGGWKLGVFFKKKSLDKDNDVSFSLYNQIT